LFVPVVESQVVPLMNQTNKILKLLFVGCLQPTMQPLMMLPTDPNNAKRTTIIAMMHLGLFAAAD
jgi:hypothetical protein